MDNIFNSLKELIQVGKRYNIRVKVISLKNNPHPKKAQEGILLDRYKEKLNFIVWIDSNIPSIQLNKIYTLKNVKLTEFKGKKQIHLDKWSRIQVYNAQIEKPKLYKYKERRSQIKYSNRGFSKKRNTNPFMVYKYSSPIFIIANIFKKIKSLIKGR